MLRTGLPLMKNILKPSANSVLIPLELTASASATDAAIQSDIMKIIKSLEDAGLLIKGVYEAIENETKEQKGGFLSMLLGTLGASLLGNLLTSKGIKQSKLPGRGIIRAGESTIRPGKVQLKQTRIFNTASSFC